MVPHFLEVPVYLEKFDTTVSVEVEFYLLSEPSGTPSVVDKFQEGEKLQIEITKVDIFVDIKIMCGKCVLSEKTKEEIQQEVTNKKGEIEKAIKEYITSCSEVTE